MRIAELDYDLPADRIAVAPAEPRDAARLMVVHRASGDVEHVRVRDLPGYLSPADLMVVNQTRVVPARFEAVREATGGRVEGLYLSHGPDGTWQVLLESGGRLRPGEWVRLDESASLQLTRRVERGQWEARLHADVDAWTLLARIGATPLPPYIRKARRQADLPETDAADADRYNTVYAADPGAVAAPTAGLHFTPELLSAIEARAVARATLTLHVGIGTFAPVQTEELEAHAMHAESYTVPAATLAALAAARRRRGRILCVGTTTVRALESLPDPLPTADHSDTTRLLIAPGFGFRFTDVLLTNFHLPRSTLLALVAALPGMGVNRLKALYRMAIDRGYRFYSYGDAMLLL